jgi:hypothetical protein
MGRLKHRYENNIKMDVSRMDMNDVNWIEVPQNRISHRGAE